MNRLIHFLALMACSTLGAEVETYQPTLYPFRNGVRFESIDAGATETLVELNVQRGKSPNDKQTVKLVREVADIAAKNGLKVALYPHDSFHIERFDHAVRIAKASERDNVGVIFNLCHFLKERPRAEFETSIIAAKGVL